MPESATETLGMLRQKLDPAQLHLFRSGVRPAFIGLGLRDALAAAGARLSPCRLVLTS